MNFIKAHALGNDFILIKTDEDLSFDYIKKICDRKIGIGCDQLLILNSNNFVKIFNNDGSVAKMCGNGLRALALSLFLNEKIKFNEFQTISRKVFLEVIDEENIILNFDKEANIQENDGKFYVEIGNLHEIRIVEKEAFLDNLTKFKNDKYNVSIIYKNNSIFHARTLELGAQETNACGSAAFAIASVLNYLGEKNLDIQFKMGIIRHKLENGKITQIGSAKIVAEGKLI